MIVVPFDHATNVTAISVRLAPIDVGCDLRLDDVRIEIPADTSRASYAGDDGVRYVVEGTLAEVCKVLRDAGYDIVVNSHAD